VLGDVVVLPARRTASFGEQVPPERFIVATTWAQAE
jgi:hypothetical protein